MNARLIIMLIPIIILLVIFYIKYFQSKGTATKISFTLVSLGAVAVILACYHVRLHSGFGITLMVCGVLMIMLPLVTLLFHNLQKENLHKMVKDEIANELNQMKAKDL